MENFFNALDNHILVVSKMGKIEFCNKSLLAKLKYDIEELKDKSFNSILNESNNEILVKNEKEKEYKLVSKNGEIIEFLGKVYYQEFNSKEAFFIVFKESVESKDSEQVFKKILDKLPFLVWVKDIHGKYKYINNTFANRLGIKEDNVIGKVDADFFMEGEVKYIDKIDSNIIKTKDICISEDYVTVSGVHKWYESYKLPVFDDDGEVCYIAGVSKDITLNKNLEYQIIDSHTKLSDMESVSNDDNKIVHSQALFNIKNELVSFLDVDSISVWIYDNSKEKLIPCLKFGAACEILVNIDEIKVDNKKFYDGISRDGLEGIKPVEKQKNLIDKRLELDDSINYLGIYKIEFNNEILGVFCIGYKELKSFKNNNDDFIKSICKKIAMIIKNDNLSVQLKKEFEKRKNVEKELQSFLETAADLMTIIDDDSRFIKVNGMWIKILGWSEKELLSMRYEEIVYEEDLPDIIENIEKLKLKEDLNEGRFTHRFKCKDGSIKWIDWNSKYIREKDVYIVTGKDITEQKLAEERNEMFEKALQIESIKNEFFTNISHEFKTPLNIILATVQVINNRIAINEEINLFKYINSIKQNSYRLLRLINNLIDMTKIDSGYYVMNLENHNIVSIVEDITISVAQYIENKGVELIFDTDIEEAIIACDPDKIERIMLNLLSNSIKYTVDSGRIDVKLTNDKENIIVSVKDSGIGIPKEKLDVIFNRFIQIESILTRRCEGSGIGLSLVKSLVEMHGGEICVNSEENKGTEVIFTLPIERVNNEITNKVINYNIINNVEKCNIEFSDIYHIQ